MGMELDFYSPSKEDKQRWVRLYESIAGPTEKKSPQHRADSSAEKRSSQSEQRRRPWRPTGQHATVTVPETPRTTPVQPKPVQKAPKRGLKQLWKRITDRGKSSVKNPDGTGSPQPQSAPNTTEVPPQAPLQFDVRMRTKRQLVQWIKSEVSTGLVFISTRDYLERGTPLQVVIEHPESKEGCAILGHVHSYEQNEAGQQAGMFIKFEGIGPQELRQLQAFAVSGAVN